VEAARRERDRGDDQPVAAAVHLGQLAPRDIDLPAPPPNGESQCHVAAGVPGAALRYAAPAEIEGR
jgi:hypothetical protein